MSYYTNPAFCEQSEIYPQTNEQSNTTIHPNTLVRTQRSASMRSVPRNIRNSRSTQSTQFELQYYQQNNHHQKHQQQLLNHRGISANTAIAPAKQQQQQQEKLQQQQKIQKRELPPKPGPKPIHFNIKAISRIANEPSKCSSSQMNEGYALVPLDELPKSSKNRYAIVPSDEADLLSSNSMRLSKSQGNLDTILDNTVEHCNEESFTSLPAYNQQVNEDESKQNLLSFSTDFINKSMILVDQKSMQRYAIVPTDDDEDMVDSNHEIIQMHNGRAHRYAVIPTDEEETCLSGEFESITVMPNQNYQVPRTNALPMGFATPPRSNAFVTNLQKSNIYGSAKKHVIPKIHQINESDWVSVKPIQDTKPNKQMPGTPTKNPIATQKLHELLSTPRKRDTLQRHASYQTIIQRSPNRYQSQILYTSKNCSEFTPQKLLYDVTNVQPHQQTFEQRTTAVISPRLQQSIYNETTMSSEIDKTWPHESFVKVENATATIGIVSLMLILTGVMNSGLCLYMVTDVSLAILLIIIIIIIIDCCYLQMRRSYFLDLGMISGFAASTLGLMGFRSRQCEWLPNRNYISGESFIYWSHRRLLYEIIF